MTRPLCFAFCLLLPFAATTAGQEHAPFTSVGFIGIPDNVELGAMSSVAVDSQDRIYVLHRGKPPLLQFDKDQKYLAGWGSGLFKVAHGLRVDKHDNVWTTDNGNHVLRCFSPRGELLKTLGEVGKPAGGETGFRSPDDLVFGSDGSIYVADSGNGRIVKLTPEGKFVTAWGKKGKAPGQFATAHGLAIDGKDRIYVADRGNQRVQVFSPEGQFVAAWGGFGNPFGLIVVGSELIASEGDKHQMFHLDLANGKITATWGNPEMLQLPHLMALDSRGRLYLAEVNGKRVQVFEPRAK